MAAISISHRLLSLSTATTKLKPLHHLLLLHFHSHSQNPNPNRSLTPLQSQFQSWTSLLKPGFSPSDLEHALRSQSDPDLALDIFRWSSSSLRLRRHLPSTYSTILSVLLRHRRFSAAESLLHEVLAGACPPDLPLFNLLIRFSTSRRHLFSTAFDLYKKMIKKSDHNPIRPDLETYKMLLTALLRRFGKPPVSYIHLHAVKSLVRQMKASGIIPDLYTLNMVIKAYAKCLEMDEAVRVFREMGLYNCEGNEYSYGYIVKGMCEKGRVEDGMRWFREMRGKGLVPTSGVFMTLVGGLAMERRFEEGREVVGDMLENGMKGDLLTYRTLLEGLCRDGRGEEAFELLEELGRTRGAMDQRMYTELLDGLHWLTRPHDWLFTF